MGGPDDSGGSVDLAEDVSATVLAKKKVPRERIAFAARLYLEGKPRPYITRALSKKYKVCNRTARRYIEHVERRLAAIPKASPEAVFQRVESMLLEAYTKARNGVQRLVVSQGKGLPSVVETFPEANVGVMASVAWRLAELHGITVQKVEVSAGGEDLSALTDEEFNTLRALKAKARAASVGTSAQGAGKGLPG